MVALGMVVLGLVVLGLVQVPCELFSILTLVLMEGANWLSLFLRRISNKTLRCWKFQKGAIRPLGSLLYKSLQVFSQKMSCLPVLCTFSSLTWRQGGQSAGAIYNATLLHNLIQMWFRHGRHVMAPGGMLLPKQRENRRRKMRPFIHRLSASGHLRTFCLKQKMSDFVCRC